ncbi:MAG: primosomal protein N' [Jaaginema sp. PMC 1080.18]|nr:primosomal protein N' [Jaaginema sp. PMC 1080.18]MEC4867815.1 primosomal protein N' [Jaaginema sp. PMC 1078.18]
MLNLFSTVAVAEPGSTYEASTPTSEGRWLEVLVDCPGIETPLTYSLPPDLEAQPGDLVSVPLNRQIAGGIAIKRLQQPPRGLSIHQIKEIEAVLVVNFFPPHYWQLLERVAQYYYTPLMNVIRVALPPGLLGRSRSRLRLNPDAIPSGAEVFCSPSAQSILQLLQQQKDRDYSTQYIRRKVKNAQQGIRDLLKRGWVTSYLEPPKPTLPKQQKAVILVSHGFETSLTPRQREVLERLRRSGGEMWLTELLQACNTSSPLVDKLEEKGAVVVQYREILRLHRGAAIADDTPKTLNAAQTEAVNAILACDRAAEFLLHGVTGSGKTEVYLQAIAPLLAAGKSALVLVPEIGLTPQLTDRFRARFGDRVCVYHSALSDGERYDTWRQMLQGEPQVIIGTRSAIFAPLPSLGAIILDEEHDSSFKQDQPAPSYHARTVAQWRSQLENCPLILGSATPALETWVTRRDTEQYLPLRDRIAQRPLPQIEIVDMRRELQQGNRSVFSQSLQNALQNLKEQGEQGILFVPRRGHSTFVSCRSCGYVMECPHCDVSLSYHRTHENATPLLRCHYCNHRQLQPPQCPQCRSPYLKFFGSGTQKITQTLSQIHPDLRAIRFDSDTTRTKDSRRILLERFRRGEADILIGTQMLTKGLDIEQVTLVGILAADGLLHRPDYRSSENAFQTLTQVAGRAGRGELGGKAILQTYTPEHPVVSAVQNYNYEGFSSEILQQRRENNYPPYVRLVLLRISGVNEREVQDTARLVAQASQVLLPDAGEILGPSPAPILRINRRYRWHILLKMPPGSDNMPDLLQLRGLCPPAISLGIDVDPMNLA